MRHQVFSRKYRPQRFDEIIGQPHICATLQNAIKHGRVSHAYLFTGSRGIGKTSTARILAKSLNCLNPQEQNPCNVCTNCLEITSGRNLDVLEIDGASNRGVEQIRDLRENVKYPPTNSRYRIYIIDEVHMLTKEAFNALLKTLEEPPEHVIFIFATTEPLKIPATILSRCQRYDFHRIPVSEMVNQLEMICQRENFSVGRDILVLIAKKADGALRDAESLLDQILSFSGQTTDMQEVRQVLGLIDYDFLFALSEMIRQHDGNGLLEIAREIFEKGINISEFFAGFTEHFRNLLIVSSTHTAEILDLPHDVQERYLATVPQWTGADLMRILRIIDEAQLGLRNAVNHRIHLDFTLLRLAALDRTVTIEQLLQQIAQHPQPKSSEPPTVSPSFIVPTIPKTVHSNSQPKQSDKILNQPAITVPSAPEPPSAKPAVPDLTFERIQSGWDEILERLSQNEVSLTHFLRMGVLKCVANSVLEIAFNNEKDISIWNNRARLSKAESVLKEQFGQQIRIRLVVDPQLAKSVNDRTKIEQLTQDVVEIFNAEIIYR